MQQVCESVFIDAGYSHQKPCPHFPTDCTAFYQKCVRKDNIGEKLYFINIYEYDISSYVGEECVQYMARVHFTLTNDDHFNVERSFVHGHTSIEELESFFMDMFKHFDCLTYDGYGQD